MAKQVRSCVFFVHGPAFGVASSADGGKGLLALRHTGIQSAEQFIAL
jgi:hypothetical protein